MSPHFRGLVAVVDDDPSVCRALERLLGSVGVRTVTHDAGTEFLSSPRLHEVDCLVLDVHMPGWSGLQVLDEVRVVASKLPVILTTGRYDSDFSDRARRAGASAILQKPFDEDDLFAALSVATGETFRP